MFVCALPLVSKSENAKEVLCALRWPLSASKSENAAKVRPLNNCPTPSSKLASPTRAAYQLFAAVECA